MKRLLFLAHRWLGIVLCAFFAMWFLSGIVMMYVGYPKLTDEERLAHLPVLDGTGLLPPREALARAGIAGPVDGLRLTAANAGQPAYFVSQGGRTIVVHARLGTRIPATDASRAEASARAYAAARTVIRYGGTVDEDAFTHSRGLDAHRPLHRVYVEDAEGTLLYISGTTGEVVRDAPFAERMWNYAGAWIHWLYPFRGNAFDPYWADIVNWLSIAGIALALTGTVAGILRWRFRRPYRSGARTPYPGAMMRWHHVGGLLFALTTITWIFSGLMSMNPWRIFDGGAAPLRMAALAGGKLDPATLDISTLDTAPGVLLAVGNIREVRWTRVLGQTLALAQPAAGRPAVLDARSAQPVAIDAAAFQTAAAGLLPDPVRRIERLTQYDLYYYSRDAHTMTGGTAKPLPVLRVVFADPQESWVHLDPHTGAVLNRSDRHKRCSRWLFAMLHSWDWLPLLERRPLWDAVLIFLGLGGAVMSVTGIVIGWRRLGRKLGAAARPPEREETIPVS